MKKLFILLIILLFPFTIYAEDYPVLNKDIFGLKLGEHENSVKEKIQIAFSKPYDFVGVETHYKEIYGDIDVPAKTYGFNGALNKNKDIDYTKITFYKNQVAKIRLNYKDGSKEKAKVLFLALSEKYGALIDSKLDSGNFEFNFKTNIDDQPVTITLLRQEYSSSDKPTIKLFYSYDNLTKK